MTDPTLFTPWQSLAGGILIGLAAVLMMLLNGRIAGVSGIVAQALRSDEPQGRWQALAFIVGLLLAVPLVLLVTGAWPTQQIGSSMPLLAAAGLLVGFGSVIGNGCTSGHGVCGLSRLSMRSLVATLVFMTTGFATVFVMRHVLGG